MIFNVLVMWRAFQPPLESSKEKIIRVFVCQIMPIEPVDGPLISLTASEAEDIH
ncbi:MAG: hypothetical protein GY750_06975 [Lentisphaerae bacterium]|nr:hypothetical protein [Lentisphaerota bacterium]MCP4101153.1 hypothetical protein [Lentisphaerota bacterium]